MEWLILGIVGLALYGGSKFFGAMNKEIDAGQERKRSYRAEQDRKDAPVRTRRSSYESIYRDQYLSPEEEVKYVKTDEEGHTNIRLVRRQGQLVMSVPQGMVNFRSRQLHKYGIYTFRVRGTSHYSDAIKGSSVVAGRDIRLRREPENEYDPNAIALVSEGGVIGFVNKQNAARIAKRTDGGAGLVAITLSGSNKGLDDAPITALVAEPDVIKKMRSSRA